MTGPADAAAGRAVTALQAVRDACSPHGLSRAAQELALAGIRQRHPDASEPECQLRLALLKLGPRLAVRAYPEAADLLDS